LFQGSPTIGYETAKILLVIQIGFAVYHLICYPKGCQHGRSLLAKLYIGVSMISTFLYGALNTAYYSEKNNGFYLHL